MAAVLLAAMQTFVRRMRGIAFVWATVVLLGGFVGEINSADFACISLLLLGWGIKDFQSHSFRFQSTSFFLVFPLFSFITTAVIASFILVITFAPWYAVFLYILLCSGAFHLSDSMITYMSSYRERLQFFYSYAALYFEIYLALGSCVVSVLRITKGPAYASDNLRTLITVFYTMVMIDSCGFLLSWLWWEVMAAWRQSTNNETLLEVAKTEFFDVRYKTTAKQGSMKGGDVNFPGFVTSEFLASKTSSRKLMESMVLLDSMCSLEFPWKDVLERQATSGSAVVGTYEVVEHLFEISCNRYRLEHRLAAITLLARLSEHQDALFNIGTVASLGDNIKQLVTALEPNVNRATLALLRRLSAFGGLRSARAGVMNDFDFKADAEDSSSPRFLETTARVVRLQVMSHAVGYLTTALDSESFELQTIALETLINLCMLGEFAKHHPISRRLVERLFELWSVRDHRAVEAAKLLELLAYETTHQEVFMQLNFESGCNVILAKLCDGVAETESALGEHATSILCALCNRNQLSQEQKNMVDVACLVRSIIREAEAHRGRGCSKRLDSAMSLVATLVWSMEDGFFNARLGPEKLKQLVEAVKVIFKSTRCRDVHGERLLVTIIQVEDDKDTVTSLCLSLLHKAPELMQALISVDEETRAYVSRAAERERLTGVPSFYLPRERLVS